MREEKAKKREQRALLKRDALPAEIANRTILSQTAGKGDGVSLIYRKKGKAK